MTSHRTQMRVFHALAACALSLATLVLGGYLFGVNLEQPYLRYTNLPFPPVKERVRAGEAVQLQVGRCNDDPIPHGYLLNRTLKNLQTGALVLLPDVWVEIPPGCTYAISQIHIVPPGTPPGLYEASGRAMVQGRFGNHQVRWYSAPFTVIEGNPS